MRALSPVLLILLVACGDDGTPPVALGSGHGQCAQRQGSYIQKIVFRDGSCGPGTETVVNVASQPTSVDPPCAGSISYSPDNCEVTYDQTCPNDGVVKGGELSISGHAKWSTDAVRGASVEAWAIRRPDGTTICQGTYDVAITRQ